MRTLYRGSTPEGRHGRWWTPNPWIARHYARSTYNQGRGVVWAALVLPAAILTEFQGAGPFHGYCELEVDTTGDPWCVGGRVWEYRGRFVHPLYEVSA